MTVPTATGGAVTEERLLQEGTARGLVPPPRLTARLCEGHAPVKLAIVVGGGFRVPQVHAALLRRHDSLRFDDVALHPLVPSVNAARELFDAYRSQLPELQERFG